MRMIKLDCRRLRSPDQGHTYLADALCLPTWYGRNLDALYDCLSEPMPATVLVLEHCAEVSTPFSVRVRNVMRIAAENNDTLMVMEED